MHRNLSFNDTQRSRSANVKQYTMGFESQFVIPKKNQTNNLSHQFHSINNLQNPNQKFSCNQVYNKRKISSEQTLGLEQNNQKGIMFQRVRPVQRISIYNYKNFRQSQQQNVQGVLQSDQISINNQNQEIRQQSNSIIKKDLQNQNMVQNDFDVSASKNIKISDKDLIHILEQRIKQDNQLFISSIKSLLNNEHQDQIGIKQNTNNSSKNFKDSLNEKDQQIKSLQLKININEAENIRLQDKIQEQQDTLKQKDAQILHLQNMLKNTEKHLSQIQKFSQSNSQKNQNQQQNIFEGTVQNHDNKIVFSDVSDLLQKIRSTSKDLQNEKQNKKSNKKKSTLKNFLIDHVAPENYKKDNKQINIDFECFKKRFIVNQFYLQI